METTFIKLFSGGGPEDDMMESFERSTTSSAFMSDFVKRTISRPLFRRAVGMFIKQHVNPTIEDCPLTKVSSLTEEMNKKGVSAPPEQMFI